MDDVQVVKKLSLSFQSVGDISKKHFPDFCDGHLILALMDALIEVQLRSNTPQDYMLTALQAHPKWHLLKETDDD